MAGQDERADRRRREPDLRPIPASFDAYAVVVFAVGAAVAAAAIAAGDALGDAAAEPAFWVLAALVVAGELLPIKVPQRFSYDSVTVSSGFALALLLAFGLEPGLLVYAAAAIVADRVDRVPAVIGLFNVGQYVLAVAAAGLVHMAAGGALPVQAVAPDIVPMVLAASAFFVVNHVLAGAASAQLTANAIRPYLTRDLGYQVWTSGFQLALAPLIVLAVQASVWLLPVACVPVLAIYLGGRQATWNEYRASHDELTDLPNRWVLTRRLEEAVASSGRDQVVLLLIDLDNFKLVNDTLGHHSGDVLLQAVAARMRASMREGDVLARLGGDEFAVLLRAGTGAATGMEVAERVLEALHEPFILDDLSIDVSASIGIAAATGGAADGRELLRRADVALYDAKDGGATYAMHSPQREATGLERLALAGQVRGALERGELFLEYQPKVVLAGDGVQGAEALVRWRHPELGVLAPELFVPLAEETGAIKALSFAVLDMALMQAAAWMAEGRTLRLSVNLSTRNLLDRDLPQGVWRLLNRHGIPPELLQLEVTESRMAADLKRTRSVLDELRAMGVSVAIDDFGTGFSSLTQLQQLPVDEIKIDRSFVIGMAADRQAAAIVRSIIDLGRNLELGVTAEGVETAEAVEALRRLGCDCLQGFYIGAPRDAQGCVGDLDAFRRLQLEGTIA